MATKISMRSPLRHWHVAHAARMTEAEGWEIPACYSTIEAETAVARAGLALADLSSFAKLSVRGSDVATWTRMCIGDNKANKPLGVSRLSASGSALTCRLREDHLSIFASGPRLELRLGGFDISVFALEMNVNAPSANLEFVNQTCAFGSFALLGSQGDMLLHRLTGFDVSTAHLPEGSCAQTILAGIPALLVRCAELTVPSLRIYVSWDLAEYLWESLLQAGRRWELAPLGLETWRALVA